MTSLIQDYCLEKMGITQWQLKATESPKPFMLLLNEEMDEAKQQLLTRLLDALKWPKSQTKIYPVVSLQKVELLAKVAQVAAKHCILFGKALSACFGSDEQNVMHIEIVHKKVIFIAIPSITELLNNVQAKKKAWEILKAFVIK